MWCAQAVGSGGVRSNSLTRPRADGVNRVVGRGRDWPEPLWCVWVAAPGGEGEA